MEPDALGECTVSILQRALIAKSGYDCGFEHVTAETAAGLMLAPARHPAILDVTIDGNSFAVRPIAGNAVLVSELQRYFPSDQGRFRCHSIAQLRLLLHRAAELAHSLPNQAQNDFETALAAELNRLPEAIAGTEVERMVRETVAAVVGFIVYGLVLALIWMRLGAPDVALTEAAIGGGLSSKYLMSYGDLPRSANDYSPGNLMMPRGAIIDGNLNEVQDVDLGKMDEIREGIAHSWYKYADEAAGLHPLKGETVPNFDIGGAKGTRTKIEAVDESAKYSWVKAPRWKGHAMEVGPLARFVIGYVKGQEDICLLYTSPSPRDATLSRMPSSA